MGDLTKNLSAHEFACDCKYSDCTHKLVAHMPLALAIQGAADHFAKAYETTARVDITDGNRCFKNNVDIQMKYEKKTREQAEQSKSMHLYDIAADHNIQVKIAGSWKRISSDELYSYYCSVFPDSCGIGKYINGRVHLDMRSIKGRWDKT